MVTMTEECSLPSKGLIYKQKFNPIIKIRSMTTEEEMLRLSHSERTYKPLCDIIDACIVGEKPPISSYDMCLGDYQYLLHKLRIATYGPEYKVDSTCPWCGTVNRFTMNLDELEVHEYTEDLEKYRQFELPVAKKLVTLSNQTPRSIDNIAIRRKEFKRNAPESTTDPTILYTLESLIESIDGEVCDPMKLDRIVRQLSMKDSNYIIRAAERLNACIGLETKLSFTCKECGVPYNANFRITAEFFGPSID